MRRGGKIMPHETTDPARPAGENTCKLCAPLGACLVFRGIRAGMPFLHGSQGCATYIRRYLISHFREPVDIASSSFSEESAVFGGGENLRQGLVNVIAQYHPELIGIASTCVSETIGDDVALHLRNWTTEHPDSPPLVNVSTPSYRDTHAEGFHATVRAVVEALAEAGPREGHINVFPGLVSPADLRHLREIFESFNLEAIFLPDYSESMDGPSWGAYEIIPRGGVPVESLRRLGRARASLEFGRVLSGASDTAASWLEQHHGVPRISLGLPIGIEETDRLFQALETLSGQSAPSRLVAERGRLVDAYIDAHKYLFGLKVAVFGEEDLVVALTAFLAETGVNPVLCASGARSGRLAASLALVAPPVAKEITVIGGTDFVQIETEAERLEVELLVGTGKGQMLSRKRGLPLLRTGFPIHDRFGGQRILHVGYRGTQELFDRLVNAVLEKRQNDSPVGYSYM